MAEINQIRVQRIMRELLDNLDLEVGPDFSTKNHPEWDSVIMVQLVLALEEEFGVQFTMEEVAQIQSVADILRLLK